MSAAIVMGPTPPGTGVSAEATCDTSPCKTSPTTRKGRPSAECSPGTSPSVLIPTSSTTAPGRTHERVTRPARPTAATTRSAERLICVSCARCSSDSAWRVSHTVTAAAPRLSSIELSGFPTVLLEPITHACLPTTLMPERSSSSSMPFGQHGKNAGSRPRMASRPAFTGLNASTSLHVGMAFRISASSKCAGSGSCTSRPCTRLSAASSRTVRSSSACEMAGGRSTLQSSIPTRAQASRLRSTYRALSARCATCTTASEGRGQDTGSAATSAAMASSHSAATLLPSSTRAAPTCALSWRPCARYDPIDTSAE
mmetsp:Transcript_16400/g.50955  ORF Transcript_16400/g.50955 Transcript_16400/m.50955 type:complete len:313 (-) Transcript_16400:223-1161(-)